MKLAWMPTRNAVSVKGSGRFVLRSVTCLCLLHHVSGALYGLPVYSPATGHYYEARYASHDLDWASAKVEAESRSYLGVSGHLATITSQAEQDFLATLPAWTGSAWIGAYQPQGSGEPDGNWQWVTGEPWGFAAWGPGQPDNQATEMWQNSLGTPNFNLTGWIDPGPSDNRFAFQFGSEAAVDVTFPVGALSLTEVVTWINDAAGYASATPWYDPGFNLYFLVVSARDPGPGALVILPETTVPLLDELADFRQLSQGGAAEDAGLLLSPSGHWADTVGQGSNPRMIVEYPVPEPSVGLLLTGGVLAVVPRKRRLGRA